MPDRTPFRLWLDDERPAPEGWTHCRNPLAAIMILRSGEVTEISFDHDLGTRHLGPGLKDGYDVALAIEGMAHDGEIPPLVWHVHSANGPGRKRIEAAMHGAERWWREHR